MKKLISCVFLLIAIPLLMGMGSLQGPASPEKIPIPVKKYSTIFVDQLDIVTECSEASIEGMTFLEGKGRGEKAPTPYRLTTLIRYQGECGALDRYSEASRLGDVRVYPE